MHLRVAALAIGPHRPARHRAARRRLRLSRQRIQREPHRRAEHPTRGQDPVTGNHLADEEQLFLGYELAQGMR